MNRSITHRFLLVIVLVTLMGAGAMSGASNAMQSSVQNEAPKNAAYITVSTDDNSVLTQNHSPALCHEERESRDVIANPAIIAGRNVRED